MGDGADERGGADVGAEDVVDKDIDFEVVLGWEKRRGRADGAEGIGTAFAEGGAVEGIVRDADVVNDGEGADVVDGVLGSDPAGGACNDDAKSTRHAEMRDSGGTWDGVTGFDPGVGGFEIEDWGDGWGLVWRGGEGWGEASDGFAKVEGDADDGAREIVHKSSQEPGVCSQKIRVDALRVYPLSSIRCSRPFRRPFRGCRASNRRPLGRCRVVPAAMTSIFSFRTVVFSF